MKRFVSINLHKFLAAFISIVLVVQICLYLAGNLIGEDARNASAAMKEDDMRIAAQLSNMSGVSTEEILRIKNTGISWDGVMKILKDKNKLFQNSAKAKRDSFLLGSGFSEDAMQRLISEGFSETAIAETKLLAERVQIQLQQIVQAANRNVLPPTVEPIWGKEENKDEQFAKLQRNFKQEEAVTYMLKLKDALDGYESVLNEYLLALQLELDLSLYLEDQAEYEDQKRQKMLGLTDSEIITVQVIEQEMLNQLQNGSTSGEEPESHLVPEPVSENQHEKNDLLPDIPAPKARDVIPMNPAEALRQEIEAIDPRGEFR